MMPKPFLNTVAMTVLTTVAAMGRVQAQEEAVVKRSTQLRAQPSESAPRVADLTANSVLIRNPQRQGAWIHVRTPSGTSGWVNMFDIGSPIREMVVAMLRRVVSKPSAGTMATATIGVRGLGQGDISHGSGSANPGPSGRETVAQSERQRVSPAEARAFAATASFQSRSMDALPVPALPAGLTAEPAAGSLPPIGDALLARALQAPDDFPEAQEVELGRQMAMHLVQGQPLDVTPGLQSYVNHLGRWLSLHSSRPSLPWTFVVVDEADFQAYSAPGGYVFVSRGLIDRCADEAELVGLIAHEIAHIAQRHGLKAMRLLAANEADSVPTLASLTKQVQRVGHGSQAEFEADRLAVAMVARAGLDPYGLLAALVQQNAVNDGDLHYAEAHPQSRLRLDHLEQAMAQGDRVPTTTREPVTVEQRLVAFAKR